MNQNHGKGLQFLELIKNMVQQEQFLETLLLKRKNFPIPFITLNRLSLSQKAESVVIFIFNRPGLLKISSGTPRSPIIVSPCYLLKIPFVYVCVGAHIYNTSPVLLRHCTCLHLNFKSMKNLHTQPKKMTDTTSAAR